MNPLKEVKHEKKPLTKIVLLFRVNFFAMKKPNINDPIIETIELLSIYNLRKVPK